MEVEVADESGGLFLAVHVEWEFLPEVKGVIWESCGRCQRKSEICRVQQSGQWKSDDTKLWESIVYIKIDWAKSQDTWLRHDVSWDTMLILPSHRVKLGASCSFRQCNFDLDPTPNNHQHPLSVSTYNNCFVYHILMVHFPSQCLQPKKWISLFLYYHKLLHYRSVTQAITKSSDLALSFQLHHDDKNNPFDSGVIFSQFPILKINQSAILNGQSASVHPSINITGSPINFQPKPILNNSDKWRLSLDVIWPKGSVIFNALTYFLKFLHFRQSSIVNHSCHVTARPDWSHFYNKTSTLTNYSYVNNPLPFAIFTAKTTDNSISLLSLVNSSSHIDSKTITKVPGWTLNFKSYIIDENNPFDPGILSSQFLISKIAWSATSNSESTLRSLAISISNWLIELKSNSMQINSDKCQITLDSAVVKELLVFQDFYTWNNSLSLKTVQTS